MRLGTVCILTMTALAGCATEIPPEQATDYQVCANTLIPHYAQLAQNERVRRGLDCGPYYQAMNAESQRRAANAAAAAQILRSMPPPPQPTFTPIQGPQQTHCSSRIVGNQVYTNCY